MNSKFPFWCIVLVYIWCILAQVDGACPSRIRRSWDSYSENDKFLYLKAVNESIVRGYHVVFAEVHSNLISNAAAHKHCGFLYWHRRFLIAYENMIRSLGPDYSCLTIPYWNYFKDTEEFENHQCNNMEECSNFLISMGGSKGTPKVVSILGEMKFQGNCVNKYPCSHICEHRIPGGERLPCSNCIIRADWTSKGFSNRTRFQVLLDCIANAKGNHDDFRFNAEMSFHIAIHEELGGVLGNSHYTAMDPIFYSHHATVDFSHFLFYKCNVGPTKLTPPQALNIPAALQGGCKAKSPDIQSTFEEVTMVLNNKFGSAYPVENHPLIGVFFKDISTKFADLVDTTNLGSHSYSYELDNYFRRKLDGSFWRKYCAFNNYQL